jgi:hypothetical protein
MLFISCRGRKEYPKVIDFLYGRTLNSLVEQKIEFQDKLSIRNQMIEALYQDINIR